MEHINNEEIPSAPATPGTPGVPLFGGFKSERSGNGSNKYKKSLLKNCKCFGVQEWTLEDGALPTVTCSLMPPPPPVPLAKKVYITEFNLYSDSRINILFLLLNTYNTTLCIHMCVCII
jgi:hypothetical protein